MKVKNLEFIVDKSNVLIFKENYEIIYEYINKNEDVPAIRVKNILSLLLTKKKYDSWKWAEETKTNIQYAVDFIENHPDYQLNWDLKGKPKTKEKKYDFIVFARIVLHAYYQYVKALNDKIDQLKTIRFFFELFSNEVEPTKKLNTKEKLTTYKIAVMAGVFTRAAGFGIASKKNPTPKEMYIAVQYAIKKKKHKTIKVLGIKNEKKYTKR